MSPTKEANLPLASAAFPLAVKRALAPFIGDTAATDADAVPPSSTRTPSKETFERASADARKCADDLYRADEQLKAARQKHEAQYAKEVTKLENEGKLVLNRFNKLEEEKVEAAVKNGDDDVSDDDIIEINAGGKIMSARRGTLTQWKGTRLEVLFSGHWEKTLLRDSSGRVFLDVDGDCFQANVVYLNQLASSTEGNFPEPPSVYDELETVLAHQLTLFQVPVPWMPDSNIVTEPSQAKVMYNWLEEDESNGEWELLYRSSRDGLSSSNRDRAFHTIIVTTKAQPHYCTNYQRRLFELPGNLGNYGVKAEEAFLFSP